MIRSVLVVIVVMLLLIFYVRYLEFTSLYYPTRAVDETPQKIGLDYRDIIFETSDHKKINGWFISGVKHSPVIYFLHGNGGNIADRLVKITFFHELGYSVFIIDYRGYGRSSGRPGEKGLYLDVLSGYEYLLSEMKVPASSIIVYGESLGGALAINLAQQKAVKALIIESSFTSVADMSRIIYPYLPAFLISSKFDSFSKVSRITVPKLFIHSTEDEIVPYALGKKLFEQASFPKEFFRAKGGHNDCFFTQPEEIRRVVAEFLKKHDCEK